MTGLALRNPIAILMIAIALVVFSLTVTPRMAVDTFPELTPPVLVVGTLAPGLGPKDVEKTLTWRIEKYVSATPGVDHVESISRNNLSIVWVWMKWGTDLNAAQTLVSTADGVRDERRAQIARRAASLRAAVRPVECAGRASRGLRRWPERSAALRLWPELYRAAARGNPRRGECVAQWWASASDQLGRGSGGSSGARAYVERRRGRRSAIERALALGRVHLAEVRRQRLHECGARSASRPSAKRS